MLILFGLDMPAISIEDLKYTVDSIGSLWDEFKGESVFITGGTGFFGIWLLESFISANSRLSLGLKITVLSRNPEKFKKNNPSLANNVNWVKGDVLSFDFPVGDFGYIIHAATSVDARLYTESPCTALDTIVNGTRRVLDFSVKANTKKFLFVSSGAVYGQQPIFIEKISEEWLGGPNQLALTSIYAEGKRISELLCSIYGKNSAIEIKVARCFAFVGPYLPLDWHFAIGNFIGEVLSGRQIIVNSDGQAIRSYMYAADLVVWLISILVKGEHLKPYNVGSEERISIEMLARRVAELSGKNPDEVVKVMMPKGGQDKQQYVPSNQRSREDLNLHVGIGLDDAIMRTLDWHNHKNN